MSLCGVIPAAGRGSRLGFAKPKLLVSLRDNLTLWDVLRKKLLKVCDHVVVIMSPWGEPFLAEALKNDPSQARISIALQDTPSGMGDAVMRGHPVWSQFDDICVMWGDQVHVSNDTLSQGKAKLAKMQKPSLVLPLTRLQQPYVEYCFDDNQHLTHILQTREGDVCTPGGLGDVGTFFLTAPPLHAAWLDYEKTAQRGARTGEINFLPFLTYLSHKGWYCSPSIVADANEAKGINTPDDLAYFRTLYKRGM